MIFFGKDWKGLAWFVLRRFGKVWKEKVLHIFQLCMEKDSDKEKLFYN
jgi:hypothetical protein